MVGVQPKDFQRLPFNKNVVQKLKKREGFGLSCELRLDSRPFRIRTEEGQWIYDPDHKGKLKYTILGDNDPAKWTVNKRTGTVIFSFPGQKIEMSFLTAHQMRALIGRLDLFENGS